MRGYLSRISCGVPLAALLLVGCGGGSGGDHDASPQQDSHASGDVESRVDRTTDDGGTPDDVLSPGEDGPLVGPTTGTIAVDFTATSVVGNGTTRLGAVAVTANAADYALLGVNYTGVAYQHHVWAGYTLYDIVSVADDGSNLAVTYLYCQGTGLPYAYTESFTLAMDYETMSGTCAGTEADTSVPVSLPALTAPPTPMDTGMTISGTDILLGASGGHLDLAGKTWELLPFNTVDCSTECPGGSWYEIHSLLVRAGEACFTILYLHLADPSTVQLTYTLCMPTLDTTDALYDAAWSGTLLAKHMAPPHLWRPPAAPLRVTTELHGLTRP
jgi:hypothetical protein